MSQMRVEEMMVTAERERLVRSARSARRSHGLRIAALRLAARGLRVERQIDFDFETVRAHGRVLAVRPNTPPSARP
jgi:RNase adaptor protein for sRNA GlmZ degradation